MDNRALLNVSYGLYLLTAKNGEKDNGCIINTLLQVTSDSPITALITVNKQNFTHDMVKNSKEFNLSVLTIETPFELFKDFGFQSGKIVDKFAGNKNISRSDNGVIYLNEYCNSYLSFKVKDIVDFSSHSLFISELTDAAIISNKESVTYSYYHSNIKPKPAEQAPNSYVCNICGYVHHGDLPEDFVCPLCKHGANDFVKM